MAGEVLVTLHLSNLFGLFLSLFTILFFFLLTILVIRLGPHG